MSDGPADGRLRSRLLFVVESGTDVRIVDGLAQRTDLHLLGRTIPGGRVVSRDPEQPIPASVGPASRLRFAALVFRSLTKRRREFDIVLVQGYGLAALAANCASRLTRTPTVMLVCSPVELYYRCRKRDPRPGMPYRAHELWALKLLAASNARIGRHYIVLSRHLRDVVRGHGTRRPISVIPIYGIDTARFKPATSGKTTIRRELDLPESGALIFFSSRIAPEKDAATLLEAVVRLTESGRDLRLLHLSGGHAEFLTAAGRMGIAGRVIARDAVHPVNELPAYYQASDVCVQASREEGLGFSPLEALACEVPVVAAATGGLMETIRDGETGWSYPAGDARSLARAIETVLAEPEEALRRARAGRAMVVAEYRRSDVFDRTMQLLERK